MTAYLDCLQSAFSLKIRLVLITAARLQTTTLRDCSQSTAYHLFQEFLASKITCSRRSDKVVVEGVKVEQLVK